MKCVSLTFACLILAAWCGNAAAAVDGRTIEAADRLRIVSTPKEMMLDGGELEVSRFEIVLPPWQSVATGANAPADRRIRAGVAAEEINERIVKLGGAALPVVERASSERPYILLAPAAEPAMRQALGDLGLAAGVTAMPEQGYLIASGPAGGRPVVIGTGADRLGTLYAAVTLRQLIVKNDAGKIVLLSGKVRDWPDFKVRRIGTAASFDQVDQCLRIKVNGLSASRTAKEVADYAHERGMLLCMGGGVGIDEYLSEAERAELPKPRDQAVSWSRKDAHAKKAEATANMLHDAGVDYYFLHAVDTGAWDDPEQWSKRGKADRAAYADEERGKASAEQFTLYHDILKKQNLDLMYEAVCYPYFFHSTDPDFWRDWHDRQMPFPCSGWDLGRGMQSQADADRVTRGLNAYHAQCGELMPDDVYICARESSRKTLEGAFRLYRNHPFTIWVWPSRSRGWEGFFAPQIRYFKSFYWPDRRDVLFYPPVNAVTQVAGAEYAWNAAATPDADDGFSTFVITYEGGGSAGHVTAYQREHLIPRACGKVFGSAGPAFEPLFTHCLSAAYVHDPKGTTRGRSTENWEDPYKYMALMAREFSAVAGAAERALADLDAGRVRGEYGDLRQERGCAQFLAFAEAAVHAASVAELEDAVRRVRDLRAAGREAEAAAVTKEYLGKLPALAARVAAIGDRAAKDGRNRARYRAGESYPRATVLDVKLWESRLKSGS